MEKVKLCHICLVKDLRMYDLQSHPLNTYFGSVTGNNLLTIVNSPPYACYECAALVKKFYFFKQKSTRSQAVLYGLIDHSGKIDLSKLKQIDRQHLGLCSNITYSSPDRSVENVKAEVFIKEETVDENIPTIKIKFVNSEMIEDDPVIETIEYVTVKTDDVKEEEYDRLSADTLLISDDNDEDEPMILHKENKFKDVKKDEDENANVALLEELKNNKEVSKVTKKKNKGNSSKLLIRELEDHVTVIKLSQQEQLEVLNKRKESSNYLNSPFQCELCYKGFLHTATWELHLRKHSPSAGAIECPICKMRFKMKNRMRWHLTHHATKYACNYCSHVSSVSNQAKYHLGQHNGITYTCEQCGEIFKVRTSYLSHVRLKHPSEFICNICGGSYVNKYGLFRHKVLKHKDAVEKGEEIQEDRIYCEQCDVGFVSMAAYKRHTVLSTKHTRNINACRTCGETFNSEEDVKKHRRKEHPKKQSNSNKTNYKWPKCEHCSEEFENGREHRSHYRRMHPDKKYPTQMNYVCDICGKSFKLNAHLAYHKRTHTGERPHKCTQCDKAFSTRQILQFHEQSHTDIRPFVCDVCHKAFKFKYAVKRHLATHTGERPYQCEICSKTFTTANGRKLHVNTVHFRQPESFVTRKRKKKSKNIDKESPH